MPIKEAAVSGCLPVVVRDPAHSTLCQECADAWEECAEECEKMAGVHV